MWKIPDTSVIIIAFMVIMPLGVIHPFASDTVDADFEELKTESGRVFSKVMVKRVDSSALVIQHSGGVARVSLFDLNASIQARYDFDPIAAMKAESMRSEEESGRQKAAILDSQRRKADLEKARKESDLIRLARTDWVPVEATVVKPAPNGIIVRVMRITLVPTQFRSTLGFLKDGPPKKILEPFAPELLVLDEVVQSANPQTLKAGQTWKGYLNPVTNKNRIDSEPGGPRLPVHEGVARTP